MASSSSKDIIDEATQVQLNSSLLLELTQDSQSSFQFDASQSSLKEELKDEDIQQPAKLDNLKEEDSQKEEGTSSESHTGDNVLLKHSSSNHNDPEQQQLRNTRALNYALDESFSEKAAEKLVVGVTTGGEDPQSGSKLGAITTTTTPGARYVAQPTTHTQPTALSRQGGYHDQNAPGAYAYGTDMNIDGSSNRNNANNNAPAGHTRRRPIPMAEDRNGLVEADPVDMDVSLQHALAVPEEDPENANNTPDEGNKSSSTEPRTLWGCAMTALVAIVLFGVLALALSLQGKQEKDDNHNKDAMASLVPIIARTIPPTAAPTSLQDRVEGLLPEYSREALLDPDSPQSQALDWLLADPNLSVILEDEPTRILTRFALATLYFATNGDQWTTNDNWLDYAVHECDWVLRKENFNGAREDQEDVIPEACVLSEEEVGVWEQAAEERQSNNNQKAIFRNVWLDTNNLDGTLPMELFAVSTLHKISLVNNPQLKGSLQGPRLHTATSLKELSVSATQLSGSVPTEIATLSALNFLVLAANKLTGTLPTQLSLLRGLILLIVDSNRFTGTIPAKLGGLPILSTLFLSNNQLSGTIPTQLGRLKFLQALSLGDNQLTGSIPSQLGSPPNTTFLALNDNTELAGTLPAQLARPFFLLNLVNTGVSGVIPPAVCFTPQLFHDCNESICGCSCNCTSTASAAGNSSSTNDPMGTLQVQNFHEEDDY